ncbi:unnamed protein product [Cuscuta epithymum]|uniref:Phosphatidylserine decarboxylase proenzyme 1, mitochondrial n=1 Tax=Cuscuta epithymum TaxID=186058 RepID=A0AAV0FP89_9ASTE|nr:unnamed protein product [Cuscuta epithymum]
MRFKPSYWVPLITHTARINNFLKQRLSFTSFLRKIQTPEARSSVNGGSAGRNFYLPGATVATIVMLGALHVRRLYDDNKIEEIREKGIEMEFQSDVKASCMRMLPLRSISRFWGFLTSVELPVWVRPYAYKAWARAFHSNLQEVALPLEEYASLREFFVRTLKDGSRPIDSDPHCLVSPVDGTILRFGELKEAGGMIEQVKGFSYSVPSLLGGTSFMSMTETGADDHGKKIGWKENSDIDVTKKSWWRVSLASPSVRNPAPACPMKGLFYCVIYLRPGDYHRIHSPTDWNVILRRHFSGRLFTVNERATRTIRNLYVENERVVLEGQWKEGFMAMAAIGATNIGSIELFFDPTLRTNKPQKKMLHIEPPEEKVYKHDSTGIWLKKGDELGAFNMGSTVVLVFQAPTSSPSDFRFCVKRGERIRMGEALGRWWNHNS